MMIRIKRYIVSLIAIMLITGCSDSSSPPVIDAEYPIYNFTFLPDEPLLITFDYYHNTIDYWSTEHGELVNSIDSIDHAISKYTYVTFSPDRKVIAISGATETTLWNLEDGVEEHIFGTRQGQLAFSPDAKQIGINNGKYIEVWDVNTHEKVAQFRTPQRPVKPNGIQFSPNGEMIAAAFGGSLIVWNIEQDTKFRIGIGEQGRFSFTPDSKYLTIVGDDLIVRWDIEADEPYSGINTEIIRSADFSGDGNYVVGIMDPYMYASSKGVSRDDYFSNEMVSTIINIWDVRTGDVVWSHEVDNMDPWNPTRVKFSQNAEFVAYVGLDGTAFNSYNVHFLPIKIDQIYPSDNL